MSATEITTIIATGVPVVAAAVVAIITAIRANSNSSAALNSSITAHARLNAIGAPSAQSLGTKPDPSDKGPGR